MPNLEPQPFPEEMQPLAELLTDSVHRLWAQDGAAASSAIGGRARARNAATEALSGAVALGWRMLPPTAEPTAAADERVDEALLEQMADQKIDLTGLLRLWFQMKTGDRAASPLLHQVLAEMILRKGEPLLAYDVTTHGLAARPNDVRLRQLQALSLARGGVPERAALQLEQLRKEGHADEETLGMLARTYKDLGLKAGEPGARQHHFRKAFQTYTEAYRSSGGYWTGINAATMALALGDKDGAGDLAREVRSLCLKELERLRSGGDRYWATATLGEAALILGESSEAVDYYASLSDLAPTRFGDLSSTRRNARLILECLGADRGPIDQCFRIPRVVLFLGGADALRAPAWNAWPPGLEEQTRGRIGERLQAVDGRIGYSSAACVADLLFLEALLQRDGEAHVVIPHDRAHLLRDWGEAFSQGPWADRYQQALGRAETLTASNQRLQGEIAVSYAHRFLVGLAGMRARQLDTGLTRWAAGDDVETLNVEALSPRAAAPEVVRPAAGPLKGEWPSRIAAILFADVAGFSKFTDDQPVRYSRYFLGMVAEALAALPAPPLVKNTWGDGLYIVLGSIRDAGNLALDLCRRVTDTQWQDFGLPAGLGLRIALHAGPVYECTDPVTERYTCTGTHVSHAARIEPITPPNQVYASRAFAALAAADGVTDFLCEYMGQTSLDKKYGVHPIYHVRQNAALNRV